MRVLWRIAIALAVPCVLVLGGARLVTLPWYPAWEYSRPNFPPDSYGMSPAERLRLARTSIIFLNRSPGSVSLAELAFSDGTLAYNTRELRHMDDVKAVYILLTRIALLTLAIAVIAGILLYRAGDLEMVWLAVSDGGIFTLFLLAILGILMATDWSQFFTGFHGIFFAGDTWIFSYSDTLIRLFPMQFWQDAGTIVAVGVGCLAMVVTLVGRIGPRFTRS